MTDKTNCMKSTPYVSFSIHAESDEQALLFEEVLSQSDISIRSRSTDRDKVGVRSFTVGKKSDIEYV